MPFELSISPTLLLAMWAGGLAIGAAVVAYWNIVGAGYFWVAGGSALMAGIASAGTGPAALAGCLLLGAGVILARRRVPAMLAFGCSGVAFLTHVIMSSAAIPAITGALALGGTTAEMLLGHWFLVDPRLPRWALKRLDGGGIVGLVADAVMVLVIGGWPDQGFVRWAFLGLAATGSLMMIGVWFSLREDGYESVMSATGLSYLSVLTALGSVAVGRFLLG